MGERREIGIRRVWKGGERVYILLAIDPWGRTAKEKTGWAETKEGTEKGEDRGA